MNLGAEVWRQRRSRITANAEVATAETIIANRALFMKIT
jgi:hypothetical protein